MPIRPEFRKFYRPPDWPEVRQKILARAKNKCEQCGKPNGKNVTVVSLPVLIGSAFIGVQFWSAHESPWIVRCSDGLMFPSLPLARAFRKYWKPRTIRVVLNIAHLDHAPGHDTDSNLQALCQWCHLNYDKIHHKETRAIRKDRSRPLLVTCS